MTTAIWPPELLPHRLQLAGETEPPAPQTSTGIVQSVAWISLGVPKRAWHTIDPTVPESSCYREEGPLWNAWRFQGRRGGPNPAEYRDYLGAFWFHGLQSDAYYLSGDYLAAEQFGAVCTQGSGEDTIYNGWFSDYHWITVNPNAQSPSPRIYAHNGPEGTVTGTFIPGETFELLAQGQTPTPVP